MNLYWAGPLEGHFKNFDFRGVGGGGGGGGVGGGMTTLDWKCQVYHNIANMKPKFNFIHILIINEDILSAF